MNENRDKQTEKTYQKEGKYKLHLMPKISIVSRYSCRLTDFICCITEPPDASAGKRALPG